MLRLFLVAQVVLGHCAGLAFPEFASLDVSKPADDLVAVYRLLTRFGGQAAYVFVCISGFFLVPRLLSAAWQAPDTGSIGQFLWSRLQRIYPTLLVALLLTLGCDLAGIGWFHGETVYRLHLSYDAVAALNWRAGLGNALSLQPNWSGAFGSNGPLWTLGYIVQFYCVGAALAALFRYRPWAGLVGLGVVLAGALLSAPIWVLVFGSWLGCALIHWIAPPGRGLAWWCLAGGAILFVAANRMPLPLGIIACGMAAGLWLHALNGQLPARYLSHLPQPLVRLNAASFAIYAFHFPIAILILVAIMPHVDLNSFGFRLMWPVLALTPGVLLALFWQSLLDLALKRGGRA